MPTRTDLLNVGEPLIACHLCGHAVSLHDIGGCAAAVEGNYNMCQCRMTEQYFTAINELITIMKHIRDETGGLKPEFRTIYSRCDA